MLPRHRPDHRVQTPANRANGPDGSEISAYYLRDDRHITLRLPSAAVNDDITVEVQRGQDADTPRPVMYLPNGVDKAGWQRNKNINIVEPLDGAWSYCTEIGAHSSCSNCHGLHTTGTIHGPDTRNAF
ncbi:hypothetical protein [Nocardia alni]|uniref:hypothetical protein n=1 Tax=Nocardia alni TaxID=2815723 RepID=UPI001C23C0E3|nr:hypothetical protein [Nocardia alni]